MKRLLSILIMLTGTLLSIQAEAPAAMKAKPPQVVGKAWYGMASWYGNYWSGKKTACGQRFDSDLLTAAHPSLPCGTWLRVTNTRTGHSEFARVTDRGPYEEGREIDVSARVAKRIDLTQWGVERVKIEIVRKVGE